MNCTGRRQSSIMIRKRKRKILRALELIMGDELIVDTLSQMGVFLVDYKSKRTTMNYLWKEFGYPPNEISNLKWINRLHPEDFKRVENEIQEMRKGTTDNFQEVYRLKDPNGGWRWISNRGGVIVRKSDGAPRFFIGVDEDMTRIKEAQEEASHRAREAETLNKAIEAIISSLDLDETVRLILEEVRSIVPYEKASVQVLHEGHLEVIGGYGFNSTDFCENLRFSYPEEGSLSTRAIRERRPWLSHDVSEDFPSFIQVEELSPTRSWIGVPLIAHGDVIGLISFDHSKKNYYTSRHLELARSLSGPVAVALENARLHGETYKLAMEDALTGIGSRHAFDLNSRYLFEKARREQREISVAMLDLDLFKKVNDEFGHQTGDIVLSKIAQTCEKGLRTTDMIARYGGEEIVIFFPETPVNIALEIVDRIRREVADLRYEGMNRAVTISAGISGCLPEKTTSLSGIIHEADAALYKAKNKGRNCVVVH